MIVSLCGPDMGAGHELARLPGVWLRGTGVLRKRGRERQVLVRLQILPASEAGIQPEACRAAKIRISGTGLMAAALPGFQSAAELGPSLGREQELEELCSRQAEQIEKFESLLERPNLPVKSPAGSIIKPEEKQALIQLLSDLGKRVEDLEKLTARQARLIDDLQKAKNEAVEDIEQIRLYFPKLIAEDRKRIAALEEGPNISDSTTVQGHLTALFEHMEAIGRKQVSFREASRCLKLSKSRVLQFKAAITLDPRFIIVHSESHKQKSLIRLRKYFDGDTIVQPPN